MSISEITDGELPRALSGLGQTRAGGVFTDGGTTVLQRGAKGEQVLRMQRLLNSFGYRLVEDGAFGPGTEAAVKTVQKKLNLAQTGVYDRALDERLTGMNQSGIVDATAADVKSVSVAATSVPATRTVPGLVVTSGTPKPTEGVSAGGPASSMVPAPGSLMEKLHNLVMPLATKLNVDPHKIVVVGSVAVGAIALYGAWWAMKSMQGTSAARPVETVTLNGVKSRRKRRKAKRKSSKK